MFYALSAVFIISFVSIVLIYFVISKIPQLSNISLSLVGVAVGSLLGDAFIHVLPEANHLIKSDIVVSLLTIFGILLFFILEKVVRWRHCHEPECSDHIIPISIVGESFHNFIDGIIIASSFIISFPLGIATSLAVLLHEVPQEIGHFAIFIHQKISLIKALRLNLFSAGFSFLGVITTFIIGSSITNFSSYILPITAGGFIYLAASDLIPEMHRHESNVTSSLSQTVLVILGVCLMAGLLIFE